jgi:general stress protein YciG
VAAPVEVAAVAEPIPAVAAAPEEVVIKPKSKRGFASMTPERRREIAAKGGKSVPKTSRYFYQSHENASNAGKIGGKVKGPRKPKAKPEAVTVAPEPTPTVVEAVPVEIPIEHTPVEHTVFDTPVLEAPVEQTVVEAQPEVAPEPVPEVVPPSPIETITEGEPEIPEYLRRLAGVKTENI